MTTYVVTGPVTGLKNTWELDADGHSIDEDGRLAFGKHIEGSIPRNFANPDPVMETIAVWDYGDWCHFHIKDTVR